MIDGVLVTDSLLHLVFGRWYGTITELEQELFEARLGKSLAASGSAEMPEDVMTLDERVVVTRKMNDLLLVAIGSDEHDEFLLASFLDLVVGVITGIVSAKATAASFSGDAENFGRLATCVEDLVVEGKVMFDDVETVLRMAKFKPLQTKTLEGQ